MKNVLIIHQSAELYGSDKTLFYFVSNCSKEKLNITVILPNNGPLKEKLEKENIKVIILPVLKLYRKMFVPKNLILFIKHYFSSIKSLYKLHQLEKFDLVYSNTLAVLLGFFFARKYKIKHLWHVHEIIESPKIFSSIFKHFLQHKTNSLLIHNSIATQNFWNIKNQKNVVIWNGVESNLESISKDEIYNIRTSFFNVNKTNDLVIGLVGRISRWKGHLLLLNSFMELQNKTNNLKLVFIGSTPPGQEFFQEEIEQKIKELELQNKVTLIPFQENINKFQQSIDIIVVPSTEPEPFGLVAIEAMFAKKPVVAANHGGLTEIVKHNETGFLFLPNNQKELTHYLSILINNQQLLSSFGKKGHLRAMENFTTKKYSDSLETQILSL
jgi:glycosyltransferase involved in cell wall biosynthesis